MRRSAFFTRLNLPSESAPNRMEAPTHLTTWTPLAVVANALGGVELLASDRQPPGRQFYQSQEERRI